MATALKHQESEQLSIEIPDGARKPRIQTAPRAYVHPDPAQPRVDADDELRASIARNGILQPIIVRPHPMISGAWMIVDGERRWRGSEGVLDEIPVLVRRDQEDEYDRMRTQLVANTGKPLTPVEEAKAFARMLEARESTIEQLAKDLGRPRSSVSERLQLLELGPWVPLLESGQVPVSYAVRALLPRRAMPYPAHQAAVQYIRELGPEDEPVAEDYEQFESLVRDAYKPLLYPLVKSSRSWDPQPEFDTKAHDQECSCGAPLAAFSLGDTPRRACANPDWWKPRQREAKKAAKVKEQKPAAAPSVKGGREFYLPDGTPTVNAGYNTTAKGVVTLTDEQGRWFIGQASGDEADAFDPADLAINDAKLVLVTSTYNAPRIGTKDAAAVKAARDKWAARWAAREQELQAEYSVRLREGAAKFAVVGPGLRYLVELLAALSADDMYDEEDFAIAEYASAIGLEFPKRLDSLYGEKRRAALQEWVDARLTDDVERLAAAIAMSRGGVPLPAAQVREERQAAADAIRKQASPWTKKPKGAKATTPAAAAPTKAPAKKGATKRAPEPEGDEDLDAAGDELEEILGLDDEDEESGDLWDAEDDDGED